MKQPRLLPCLPKVFDFIMLSAMLPLFSPTISAQQFYVIDENQKLHLVDIANCQTTFLVDVNLSLGNYGDISFHPNGKLYGITFGGTLNEINLQTGAVTQVGQLNAGSDYNSLVVNGDGVFYAASVNGDFASFNLQTGTQTHDNASWGAAGDLTFHDGQLYLASTGNNLLKINIANPGQSSVFFNFPSNVASVFGIISVVQDCNEVFTYALTFEDSGSKVYLIDFENQQLTFKCTLPVKVYGGASQLEFNASSSVQLLGIEVTQPSCGKADGSIIVQATAENNTLLYSLDGVNFQASNVFNEIPAGSLTIYIDDGNECTKDTTIQVQPVSTDLPIIESVNVSPASCNAETGSIEISAIGGTGNLKYSINGGASFDVENTFENLPGGTYPIVVKDSIGCPSLPDTARIASDCPVFVPNVFSPNGDGINDDFRVYSSGDFLIDNLLVFNRWGGLVFELSNVDLSSNKTWWEGTFKGKKADVGVYVYYVELTANDGTKQFLEGGVTLIR